MFCLCSSCPPRHITTASDTRFPQTHPLRTQQQGVSRLQDQGVLPTLFHNADGNGYRLRLNNGQYLSFDTLEQAQQALWAEPEARAIGNNRYLREVINNDLATLQPGQNRKTIVSREMVHSYNRLEQMPDGPAKEALRAQLAEREALADQHDGPLPERQAYDEQAALIDATAPDPAQRRSARAIIGESYEEFIDGVYVSVSRLNRGATPLTLVEENLEHDARRILAQPEGRDSLLEAFRDTEAKLGEKLLLTDDNAQVSDQQLIESFSRLGVDLFVGESRGGQRPVQGKPPLAGQPGPAHPPQHPPGPDARRLRREDGRRVPPCGEAGPPAPGGPLPRRAGVPACPGAGPGAAAA